MNTRQKQIIAKVTHYATQWENGNNRANSALNTWRLKGEQMGPAFAAKMEAAIVEAAPTRTAAAKAARANGSLL